MARVWSSGWELNNPASVEWTSTIVSTGAISSSIVRSGLYSYQITSLVSATSKGERLHT